MEHTEWTIRLPPPYHKGSITFMTEPALVTSDRVRSLAISSTTRRGLMDSAFTVRNISPSEVAAIALKPDREFVLRWSHVL
jgi:hypothetical protein